MVDKVRIFMIIIIFGILMMLIPIILFGFEEQETSQGSFSVIGEEGVGEVTIIVEGERASNTMDLRSLWDEKQDLRSYRLLWEAQKQADEETFERMTKNWMSISDDRTFPKVKITYRDSELLRDFPELNELSWAEFSDNRIKYELYQRELDEDYPVDTIHAIYTELISRYPSLEDMGYSEDTMIENFKENVGEISEDTIEKYDTFEDIDFEEFDDDDKIIYHEEIEDMHLEALDNVIEHIEEISQRESQKHSRFEESRMDWVEGYNEEFSGDKDLFMNWEEERYSS